MAKHINYSEHISVNNNIMGGKPVIKGTRIPVETVLERLANDLDTKTLFADYPRLTEDDIKACLSYAQDVLGEIYPTPEGKHQHYANL
jgi:uncharacterized protein (DUF433 family)